MKLVRIEKGLWVNPDKVIEVYDIKGGKETVIVLPDRVRTTEEKIESVIMKLRG